jgi:hypothetical protein
MKLILKKKSYLVIFNKLWGIVSPNKIENHKFDLPITFTNFLI